MTDNPETCGTCPLKFDARTCPIGCERADVAQLQAREAELRVWLPKYGNAITRTYQRTND